MIRIAAGFMLLGTFLAPTASAMTLNPRGVGQVLLFPYYTVNRQQQTLVTVTNTTDRGKALEVRFREGFNGREALAFHVFLAAHDTWTGTVFALDDAGVAATGAAVLVVDTSCTAPDISVVSPKLPDGRSYQPFLTYFFTGSNADTGPTDDTRTREGFLEIIEMAEVTGNTLAAITLVNGVPANCAAFANDKDPPASDLAPPTGGLTGTEAIVNVAQGTMFSANAEAIEGFADQSLYFPIDSPHPNLADASVSANGFVSAYVPLAGAYLQLDYPLAQAIDAVSAVLTVGQVMADWDISASVGAHTDWVLTLPTKQFYVDQAIIGSGPINPIAPFDDAFGGPGTPGASFAYFDCALYDRNGTRLLFPVFDPRPPTCAGGIAYETQTVSFLPQSTAELVQDSAVLGSHLVSGELFVPTPYVTASVGTASLAFGSGYHLRPTNRGFSMNGLPVIGFAAVDYVNANVSPGVLANYSGAYPLRSTASCTLMQSNLPAGSCTQ